jgi:hypothetical protein
MRRQIKTGMLAALLAALALPLGGAAPAQARHSRSRENLWRYGTYAGAGATAYALAKGKGTWGLIGAGATYLSYRQWKNEVRRRHQHDYGRARYRRYRQSRYRRSYYRPASYYHHDNGHHYGWYKHHGGD